MASTTLSTKGQVIIPRALRQEQGLVPGMTFEVEAEGNCIVLRPVPEVRRTTLKDLVGCVGYHGPRKTLQEMLGR